MDTPNTTNRRAWTPSPTSSPPAPYLIIGFDLEAFGENATCTIPAIGVAVIRYPDTKCILKRRFSRRLVCGDIIASKKCLTEFWMNPDHHDVLCALLEACGGDYQSPSSCICDTEIEMLGAFIDCIRKLIKENGGPMCRYTLVTDNASFDVSLLNQLLARYQKYRPPQKPPLPPSMLYLEGEYRRPRDVNEQIRGIKAALGMAGQSNDLLWMRIDPVHANAVPPNDHMPENDAHGIAFKYWMVHNYARKMAGQNHVQSTLL